MDNYDVIENVVRYLQSDNDPIVTMMNKIFNSPFTKQAVDKMAECLNNGRDI